MSFLNKRFNFFGVWVLTEYSKLNIGLKKLKSASKIQRWKLDTSISLDTMVEVDQRFDNVSKSFLDLYSIIN